MGLVRAERPPDDACGTASRPSPAHKG